MASLRLAVLALVSCIALQPCRAVPSSPPTSRDAMPLTKRYWSRGKCTDDQWGRFSVEESFGIGYANKVRSFVDENNFSFETWIPKQHLDEETATRFRDDYLLGFANLVSDDRITVTINCGDLQDSACTSKPKNAPPGWISYANTNHETNTITLCDAFFTLPESSERNKEWCNEPDRLLDEFETGAFTLIHEYAHLGHTLQPRFPEDVAWGAKPCADLAENDPDEAIINADNWMMVTMGAYWADLCGREIPFTKDDL